MEILLRFRYPQFFFASSSLLRQLHETVILVNKATDLNNSLREEIKRLER